MNPNLTNVITRFVNIDTQYRDYSSTFDVDSTDFTLCLSERLSNVLSMRLFSYQIPYTWLLIDAKHGNNCFWIRMDDETETAPIAVTIPNGNYTYVELSAQILTSLIAAGFTTNNDDPCTINTNTRIMTLNLHGLTYGDKVTTEDTKIVFFDPTKVLTTNSNVGDISYLTHTFGWLCGFRISEVNVFESGNVATAIASLTYTKYLTLVVDDYNQNHVNNAMLTISNLSSSIKFPSYPRGNPFTSTNNVPPIIEEVGLIMSPPPPYVNSNTLIPSAPRTLTNNQLYAMNEVKKNQSK